MHINTHRKSAGLKKPVAEADRQEHSLLDAILNSSENVTIFSLDKNYCYTSFNHSHIRNMKKVWGVDIKAGMNLLECMRIPELRKMAKASIDRALLGEAFSEVQFQPDVDFYFEFFWNPVYQNKKVTGVTAFITNITERKQAEQGLLHKKELLKRGEMFARFGSWKVDLNSQMVYASEGAQKIYGDEREKITLTELKAFRLPEYDRFLDEGMMKLIAENEPYDVEFKIKRKNDGQIIDVHSKAEYDAATNTIFGTIQDITQRKKAEEALVKSEMQYRSILDASPDGIVITDLQGRLQLVSPMALKIFRYHNPLEVLGRQLTDFVRPEDREHILTSLAIMFEQHKSSSGEYMALCRDGCILPVEVNTSFIRNAAGEPTNLITIIRDITERRKTETELAITTEQLMRTAAIAKVGGWEFNFETGKRIWSKETCRILETDEAGLAAMGDGVNLSFYDPVVLPVIKAAVQAGLDDGTGFDLELPMITAKGKHIWARHQGNFERVNGKTIRVDGFIQDITGRKQIEALLEESKIRYQGLSDAAYEAIFISENGICLEQNKMAAKMFGYTDEEAIGSNGIAWIAAEDRETVIRHVQEKNEEAYEVKAIRKDGTIFPCIIRGKQMNYKGRIVRVSSISDITELKEREQEINRQQRFTEVLLHSIPTPVFYKDKEGRYLGCNEAFSNQTGVKSEDITGKTVMEIWSDSQAEVYHQKDLELMENPGHQIYESTITDKDGEIRDVLFAKDVFYDEKGNIAGIIGAYIDITENKRLDIAKSAVQERIMKIAKLVPGVIYQYRLKPDGSSDFLYASESLYTIFHVRPDDVYADARAAFSKIHPEDYPDFVASINRSAAELSPWQHECRIVLDNGNLRYIYGSSMPEQELDGSVLWHGFITDVTEHKFAEERIRQLSKAVDQSPVSIVITDTGGNIQYVNPKFVELTGYSFEEALGKNPSILKSGHTTSGEYKKLWETITHGETWRGDLHNKKKNGELYWESVSISPVINEQGETTHFLAVKEDITERKKAEAEIERMAITLDTAPNAITVHDFDGNFLYSNQRNLDMHGYTKEELMHINLHQLDVPASEELIANRIQELQRTGEISFEAAHYRKDGTIVPLEVYARLTNWGDSGAVLSMATDITERLEAEKKLQELLKSYEFVNKATSDTIWEWDINTNAIDRNENFTKTFGYKPDGMTNNPEWAGNNIHPEDYKRVKQIINNAINNKLENWQAEYRYCTADGLYKYVYDRGFLLFDDAGNPFRMYGAMTDLTEKKNLKNELAVQQLKQQKELLEVNIQAHEEEKSELGKELHDNISQMLATVKMYLGLAKAGRTIPEFNLLGKSYDYVEETITELRKLSHSLVPPSLGEIGLQEALRDLIHIANVVKDMSIKLVVDKKIKSGGFDKKLELMIYRIVQEQLNNINKYASAKNVDITIKKEKNWLLLTITDDGVGFDMANKSKGIGLRNMSNRVEFYSGKLDIITAPGAGCTIKAKIPYNFNSSAI